MVVVLLFDIVAKDMQWMCTAQNKQISRSTEEPWGYWNQGATCKVYKTHTVRFLRCCLRVKDV